jgi:N-acetylneuraminic acid mutarotase
VSGTGAVVNGKIYYFHGSDTPAGLFEYDPVANVWTTKAPGKRRYYACAVGVNSKLYIFGGMPDGSQPTDDIAVYDPATDTWTTPALRMLEQRGSFVSGVALGDTIFAMCGQNAFGGPSSRCEKLDVSGALEFFVHRKN